MASFQIQDGRMEIIRKPDKLIETIVSEQAVQESAYRKIQFCLEERVDEGVLVLNALTHEMVLLSDAEYAQITGNPYMIRKWFCVPEDFADRQFARQVRELVRIMHPPSGIIRKFTVFTTTACNARCFYCYEKGWKITSMEEGLADQAADFILRKSGDEVIQIDWFGGEPLCNARVIDRMSDKIQRSGRDYYGRMISNGSLFNEKTVQKAVDLWHLKSVEITVDGTEPVYGRIKNYKDTSGNPFRKVLDNIDRLQQAGIGISIRLNMDRHNAEDLYELIDILGERFGGRDGMYIMPMPLYENLPANALHRSEEHRRVLFDHYYKLADKIESYGLHPRYTLKEDFRYHMCMADSDEAVTIMPDGQVGLCEHYQDTEMIGDIWHDDFDHEVCRSFKQEWPEVPACEACGIYPECIRLEKCSIQICHRELSGLRMWRARKAMINAYRVWRDKIT